MSVCIILCCTYTQYVVLFISLPFCQQNTLVTQQLLANSNFSIAQRTYIHNRVQQNTEACSTQVVALLVIIKMIIIMFLVMMLTLLLSMLSAIVTLQSMQRCRHKSRLLLYYLFFYCMTLWVNMFACLVNSIKCNSCLQQNKILKNCIDRMQLLYREAGEGENSDICIYAIYVRVHKAQHQTLYKNIYLLACTYVSRYTYIY